MEKMGRQKLVDKTITPQEVGALQTALGPYTVPRALQDRLGVYLLGGYKGQTVFVDLDKLVNEPLVNVEKQHILGVLQGATEGRDLLTRVVEDATPAGNVFRNRLTVPSGEVWFVHAIRLQHGAELTTGVITLNWRCSIFPSEADPPDEDGAAFYPTAKSGAAAALDEIAGFYTGAIGTADPPTIAGLLLTNKDVSLRLPPGATITLVTTVTTITDAEVTATLELYGYKGRRLVA